MRSDSGTTLGASCSSAVAESTPKTSLRVVRSDQVSQPTSSETIQQLEHLPWRQGRKFLEAEASRRIATPVCRRCSSFHSSPSLQKAKRPQAHSVQGDQKCMYSVVATGLVFTRLGLLISPSGTVTFMSAMQRLKSICGQTLLGSKGRSSPFEPDPATGMGQSMSSVTPGTTCVRTEHGRRLRGETLCVQHSRDCCAVVCATHAVIV